MRRVGVDWRWIGVGVVAVAIVVYAWPRDAQQSAIVVQPATPADVSGNKRDRYDVPAVITGVVRDAAQQPLAGARVCIADDRTERHCTQSKRDGRFELAGAPADDLVLDTQLASYRAAATYVPLLAPGESRTVEIVLAGDAVEVRGVVEDILGGPIEHADVTVETARVQTDAQGRFEVWLAPADGQRFIHAHAAGYGPGKKLVRAAGATVITLSPEATLAGKVVDGATGAPIAGARVIGGGREVTSEADGAFTLRGLPTGTVSLEAITPTRFGKLPRSLPLGLGEHVEDVVVQVYPAYTVVAALTVDGDRQICNPTPRLSDGLVELAKPWRDENGRYHFEGVPPGVYTPELGCGAALASVVVADANVEVAWRIGTGGIVKGAAAVVPAREHLVDVTLARVGSRAPPFVRAVIDGRYELRGIPAGTYTLAASANGQPAGEPVTIEVGDGRTVERDLLLDVSQHGRITGNVTDRGKPAYANVRFQGIRAGVAYQVDTRDGKFEIDLPADDYQVHGVGARAWGTSEGVARVRAGVTVTRALVLDIPLRGAVEDDGPIEPSVERDYVFSGLVVDAHGPVDDALVTAIDTGGRSTDERVLRATTLADGTFMFTAKTPLLAVDVYRVGGGGAQARLYEGRRATITLAASATLTGTVTRADGARASRFEVYVDDRRTHPFQHTGGAFAIPATGAYPVVLTAAVNGLAGQPVTVTAASAKAEITLQLPPTVTVTGRVVDAETRQGIANVRVAGRRDEGWVTSGDVRTDDGGRFTMRDLPPGTMRLDLTPTLDGWSAQTIQITVPDANGDVGELGLARARRR